MINFFSQKITIKLSKLYYYLQQNYYLNIVNWKQHLKNVYLNGFGFLKISTPEAWSFFSAKGSILWFPLTHDCALFPTGEEIFFIPFDSRCLSSYITRIPYTIFWVTKILVHVSGSVSFWWNRTNKCGIFVCFKYSFCLFLLWYPNR